MSWGTCYYGSSNIHFDFPPIMSDGRNFSNWIPSAEVSELIRKDAGIKHNHEYRTYLVNNADYIIKNNQITACDECCQCPPKYGTGKCVTNGKYLYKSCNDDKMPFGYESSDLKNSYLSRQQLQSRMVAPIVSQEELLRSRARM